MSGLHLASGRRDIQHMGHTTWTRSLPVGGNARQRDEPTPAPPVQKCLLREGHVAVAKALKEEGPGLANDLAKMRTAQPCSAERAGKRVHGEDEDSLW